MLFRSPPNAGRAVTAVRFVGDRVLFSSGPLGHVLSVVDLRDRAKPTVTGEIDLGASGGYIHPLNENRIAVVGATLKKTSAGVRSGIQVATVDLADLRVLDRWVRDNANTSVANDHHAFTWWPQRSIAAFGFNNGFDYPTVVPPESVFLELNPDSGLMNPRIVRPRDIDRGPVCKPDEPWDTGCDWTGPPTVERVFDDTATPGIYTSETLESLDPGSLSAKDLIDIWNITEF